MKSLVLGQLTSGDVTNRSAFDPLGMDQMEDKVIQERIRDLKQGNLGK